MERKLKTYQISIFTTLFIGYACYAYNRKSVSLAMPKLMEEGLDKNQAGKYILCVIIFPPVIYICILSFTFL